MQTENISSPQGNVISDDLVSSTPLSNSTDQPQTSSPMTSSKFYADLAAVKAAERCTMMLGVKVPPNYKYWRRLMGLRGNDLYRDKDSE